MWNIKLKEAYIFIPVLAAYFFLGIFYPFLGWDIPKFLLFQSLFLLLPGYLFSKLLIRERLTKIQGMIFGYPVSMVAMFILSWIGKLLNVSYLEGAMLLFSIMSIYRIVKDGDVKAQEEINAPIALQMFFYGVCIIIVFRMFILPSSVPTPDYPGLYYQDSLWTIANTWSYIRGFPLEDPRFSGVLFGYHMLQNIYQATVFKFTGIQPFNIHFYIEPVFDWLIIVFLVFYGGIKIAKLSIRETAVFYAGLFFTTPFLARRLQLNLFVNPLSFYFGTAVFILFIFCVISYLDKKRSLDIIYLTVLFIYITATKAILGIIIPVTLMLIFALNISRKKFCYKEALLMSGLFLGAVLLKLTMFQNVIHGLYYDYDTTQSLAYQMLSQAPFLRGYKDMIYPFYRFFSSFFRYLPRYIFSWPVLLFLIIAFTDAGFRRKLENIKDSVVFIFIFFLVSITVGCLFMFPGAEIYNIWYTEIVFLILGAVSMGHILNKSNIKYKIAAASLIIFGAITCFADLNNWIKIGWAGLPNTKERVWDKRAAISYDEFLAMKWLRENTDFRKVFFSDRRYFTHEGRKDEVARFHGYTALSGRQAFAESENVTSPKGRYGAVAMERWDLINEFLSSEDRSEQKILLKSIKADYFIQSLRFNDKDFSGVDGLTLVYQNKDVKIFKISRESQAKEMIR